MKTKTKVLIVIGIVLLLVGFWFFGTRNSLVSLKEDVEMQQSQIETTLQRRNDLIPNLVATVKGYATHEKEVFTEIAEARAKLAGSIKSNDLNNMDEANDGLNSALGRLLAISENYPDLKANQNFLELQAQLEGTENRIAVARKDFNNAVKTFNTAVRRFPANILASLFGFEAKAYLQSQDNANQAPQISF